MDAKAESRRSYWVSRLQEKSNGTFENDTTKMIEELQKRREAGRRGTFGPFEVLRAIPEKYGHDSSEEKLYSKYTDAVVSEALSAMGLNSVILDARAVSADVQARATSYSLVADAKAFRLSRTAKNQKGL